MTRLRNFYGKFSADFVNLWKGLKNAWNVHMAFEQHSDNLWKSLVLKLLRLQKVARKEKVGQNMKSCPKVAEHPWDRLIHCKFFFVNFNFLLF